jgi:phosphinothricin acetyltransferase
MVEAAVHVRPATEADAVELLEIYRPFVEKSTVSFEVAVPSLDEFRARVAKALSRWQWLVAERDGCIAGYAYGGSHRERAAYRWSVEVSAYVGVAHHRLGIARALYTRLFRELAELGYCNAYAGITLPNEASVGLHRSMGFEPIGTFPRVGRKFGRWHDVAWLSKVLRDAPTAE